MKNQLLLHQSLCAWGTSVLFLVYQLYLQLSIGVLVSSLATDFSMSNKDIALFSSSFYFIYIMMQVPTSYCIQRWGARRIIMYGASFCTLGCFMMTSSTNLMELILGRIIIGFGSSGAFVACIQLAAYSVSRRRLSFMIGLAETIMMLGTWVAVNGLSHLLVYSSWRYAMMINTFWGFAILLLTGLSVPKQRSEEYSKVTWDEMCSLIKQPTIWWHGMYIGLMFSLITVFSSTWAVPLLINMQDISNEKAVFAMSWVYLGVGCASPIIGCYSNLMKDLQAVCAAFSMMALIILALFLRMSGLNYYVICTLFFALGITASITVLNYEWVQTNTSQQVSAIALGLTNSLALLLNPALNTLMGQRQHINYPLIFIEIIAISLALLLCTKNPSKKQALQLTN